MQNIKKILISNLHNNLMCRDATYGYFLYDAIQRKKIYNREMKKINIFLKNYQNMTIKFFRNNCDIAFWCDIQEINHKNFNSYQDAMDAGAVAAFIFKK